MGPRVFWIKTFGLKPFGYNKSHQIWLGTKLMR
jgi:hypothetical protein